ncbi:hypothetical protein OAU93_00475 [bacterium]|nr:hypothetical protein [bacterium]
MTELLPYLWIDLACVAAGILYFRRQLTFIHPLTQYLFFHLYCITWRGWALYLGAEPMYKNFSRYKTIESDELIRGIIFADISLVAFCCGVFFATQRNAKRHFDRTQQGPDVAGLRLVHPQTVTNLILFFLPVGLIALFASRFGLVPSSLKNIVGMAAFWPSAVLLMAMFVNGFRWFLVLPVGIYLGVVALQGFHRFMLILPLIYMVGLYLRMHGKRWPNAAVIGVAVLVALIFPELKNIGRAYQAGDTNVMFQSIGASFDLSRQDRSANFLDQMSGSLSMVDKTEKIYFGRTYTYAITLPYPRFLWPEKPGLAQHVIEVSTDKRQYDVEGRVITLIGESYFNFRQLGVALIPFLLAWILTSWYLKVIRGNYMALENYVYLVFMSTFIQVFRDGLTSFAMFGVFMNAAMATLVLLYFLFPNRAFYSQSFLNNPNEHPHSIRV